MENILNITFEQLMNRLDARAYVEVYDAKDIKTPFMKGRVYNYLTGDYRIKYYNYKVVGINAFMEGLSILIKEDN